MCRLAALAFAGFLIFIGGCAQEARHEPAGVAAARVDLVAAASNDGFNFPYLLRIPSGLDPSVPVRLLVEPNNSGVSENFDDHVAGARKDAENAVSGQVSRRLNIPLLMPVFPRSTALYTHSLNRRTLLTAEPRLQRLDLQLLAMVADARRRLPRQGIRLHDKVLLTGFSASGTFATRFAALHPDAVQALAAGAVNGLLILPMARLGTADLPYPLGIGDLPAVAGRPFDAQAWRRVPQFLYMGADDTNDAIQFDDAYTVEQRRVVHENLGQRMLPDRWERCQQLYREAGASATFTTYPGIGHFTNGRIHDDVAEFFRRTSPDSRR